MMVDQDDMAEAKPTRLTVGAAFYSFDEIEAALYDYQEKNFVQMYIRDSRTIRNGTRRVPHKKFNPSLKYSEITFACVHGGRKYKSQSNGARPNQKTFLMDCPVHLKIRVSPDGQALIIRAFEEEHNHSLSKAAYMSMPQRRTSRHHPTVYARGHLRPAPVQPDRYAPLVSQYEGDSTEQSEPVQGASPPPVADLEGSTFSLVETMRKIPGATVHVKTSTSKHKGTLNSIFFQTSHMKNLFHAFPEVLLFDASLKHNETKIPLYLLMIVDSNGEFHITGLFMALLEDSATIAHLISSFKASNPHHIKTECVMADVDMPHRNLFAVNFPNVTMSMADLHTLRAFRRDVSAEKLGISPDQKAACLQTMEKMVSAQSKEEYEELYNILQFLDIPQVLTYFNDNWQGIREEWVEGLRSDHKSYVSTATKHLETTIQKVKNVIKTRSAVPTFFQDVLRRVESLALEKGQKVVEMVQKVKLKPDPSRQAGSAEEQFERLLTPHALTLVKQQLQLALSITVIRNVKPQGMLHVKAETCPCSFFKVLKLPCRHLFAARRGKGLGEFDATLCCKRWTRQYYLDHCGNVRSQLTTTGLDPWMRDYPAGLDASEQEKYSQAVPLAQRLALAAARLPDGDFQQAVSCMETVADAWEKQEQVMVACVDPDPQNGSVGTSQAGTTSVLEEDNAEEDNKDSPLTTPTVGDSPEPPRKKMCLD